MISCFGTLKPARRVRQCSVEGREVEARAFGQHDDRDRPLAPALIAQADDRDFAHLRQIVDDALDLGGGDVLAAGDDHVLLAVGQIQKAVCVEIADIAAAEPVAEEGGRGLLRVLPIAAA